MGLKISPDRKKGLLKQPPYSVKNSFVNDWATFGPYYIQYSIKENIFICGCSHSAYRIRDFCFSPYWEGQKQVIHWVSALAHTEWGLFSTPLESI